MEEPVKKPRRNITANIKGRLNSGAYNKTRNLKRNMRALKEKVREFEKKGELKAFVQARYDATRGLLRRLEELEAPVPVTAVAAAHTATDMATCGVVAAAGAHSARAARRDAEEAERPT